MELNENLVKKVSDYKPSPSAIQPILHTPILFVVGITGAGKDTIQQELVNRHLDDYRFIVSHTTRAPRSNNGKTEQDGVDYHFVDFATVDHMLDEGQFVEAKIVHFDNIYGTAIAEIAAAQAAHKIAITDIEVQGVREYVELGMNVKPVFLLPPTYDIWLPRLQKRYGGAMPKEELHKRMQTALMELENATSSVYFYIVVNDDLEKTIDLVNRIAHGEAIEPHYHKAMAIAEDFLVRIRTELAANLSDSGA